MKIIKRDGRIVEYDRDKIFTAISKANRDVREPERASNKQIETIIKHIEELNKKRMLVEDIQDFIETDLMKIKKYALAKSYIIYRYTRALVRKNNNTDESILSIIKNGNTNNDYQTNNQNIITNRNLIASEVSKNLSKRILLPEKTVIEHENGFIYFHDMDYFLQPFINSSKIDFMDMLENGTIINNYPVNKPNCFLEAIILLSEIIQVISSCQCGKIKIDITKIAKYLKNTKELEQAINILYYQLNNLITIKGTAPDVNLLLKINSEYENDSIMIIREILKQFRINNHLKLFYELNDNNNTINSKYYELTKQALECPDIILTNNKLLPEKKEYQEKYFNIGIVSINLVKIFLQTQNDEKAFYQLLDEKLDIAKEALMAKYHSLLGTSSSSSPILWQNGALGRLNKDEKIDKLLKNNATLSLGCVGITEINQLTNNSDTTIKILKYLKKQCDNWKKETNLYFNLIKDDNIEVCSIFLKSDLEKFGIIKNITDKEHYDNSFIINKNERDTKIIENSKYQGVINHNYIPILKIYPTDKIDDIINIINQNMQYVMIQKESEEKNEK